MSDDDILAITARQGRFNVSLRWRDIPLQKQCNALVKNRRLQKVGRIRREIVYVLPQQRYRISNGGYLILETA